MESNAFLKSMYTASVTCPNLTALHQSYKCSNNCEEVDLLARKPC